ncbi:MAG: prepilin-type N-terminal cleavage/methylation domain-containing protein [Gemmatimonadales bacterium]
MIRDSSGFTITEVLIAVIVLAIGVLALVGGAGAATKMLSQGQRTTSAVGVGAGRLDRLRNVANATNPRCTSSSFATGTATTNGVSESWTVPTSGASRTVVEAITYKKYGGTITDSLVTIVNCNT